MKKTAAALIAVLASSAALAAADAPVVPWAKDDFTPLKGGAKVENTPEGNVLVLPHPGAAATRRAWPSSTR